MNSEKMYEHSSIGRPLDPSYPTNLLILILTPLSGIIAGGFRLFSTGDLWLAVQAGFWMGAAVFIAWALSREIDPDNDWSAFLAVAFITPAMFFFQFPSLAIFGMGLALLGMRIVSRIVGPAARIGDSGSVIFLTILTVIFGQWLVGLLAVAIFLMDAAMSNPNRQQFYFAGGALLLVALRGFISLDATGELSLPYLIFGGIVLILFLGTILATRKMRVSCDVKGYDLDVRRVRAAMSLGLLTVLIPALYYGDTGIISNLPMWASLLAVSLYHIPITVQEFLDFRQRQSA